MRKMTARFDEKKFAEHATRCHVAERLRRMLNDASLEALRICQAWHGPMFGFPGTRLEYPQVYTELQKAELAVEVIRSMSVKGVL